MLKIEKYARKPFYVEAVRVTHSNMEEAAEWCGGEIRTADTTKPGDRAVSAARYIKVKAHLPLNENQTKAFIGDWILRGGGGYKVYNPNAFERHFDRVLILSKSEADKAGITPPIE